MGTPITADDGGSATAGNASDLNDRRQYAVGGVAVVEPRGDQQFPVFAGLRGVYGSAGGVVQLDRHHHSRQHDRLSQEKDGHSTRHARGFRHSVLQSSA